MFTLILTLSMCALLFLMIWAATYFYPWTGLLRFFPKDIEEKARQHKPPFPAAPVIGWIIMLLCALGFAGLCRRDRLRRMGWPAKRVCFSTIPDSLPYHPFWHESL